MVGLSVAVCRRLSASVMILRCAFVWNGGPNWWPIMNGTNTARGGLMASVTSRATETETVGTPRRSIARWTSAMLWWQMGQAGARRTTSARSASTTASAMFSASVVSSSSGAML